MKTDDLIDALAVSLAPAKPARPSLLWLAAAAVAATAAVALLLGVRVNLSAALQTPAIWTKAAYTSALAASAAWLAWRLGRPGTDPRPALWATLGVVAAALTCGGLELATAAPGDRLADWLGRTWRICGRNIVVVSLFAVPLVFLSGRSLAPTRPAAAGGALGAAAGGLAATAYGLLHCPESSAAFVATWYTLGIGAVSLIGASMGRFALRW